MRCGMTWETPEKVVEYPRPVRLPRTLPEPERKPVRKPVRIPRREPIRAPRRAPRVFPRRRIAPPEREPVGLNLYPIYDYCPECGIQLEDLETEDGHFLECPEHGILVEV